MTYSSLNDYWIFDLTVLFIKDIVGELRFCNLKIAKLVYVITKI